MKMRKEDKPPFWSGLVWGLAEGIFLFIVPDALLCYWALKSVRAAGIATIAVVVGAMVAAVLIYGACALSPALADRLVQLWALLPGYYPSMSEVAAGHLALEGAPGILSGPTSGIAYRAYVLEAWLQQVPLWKLLVWTPLARLERILIAPVVVLLLRGGIQRWIAPRWGGWEKWEKVLGAVIVVYWVALYVWYWGFFLPGTYGGPGAN